MSDYKKSSARRWAEAAASNFETTSLSIPEGLEFWKLPDGVCTINIVPYTVKSGGIGVGAVKGGNPYAEKGELWFERTYWQYSHIGPGDNRYVAPGATFGIRDYIAEVKQALSRKPGHDPAEVKALEGKQRQLWLLEDLATPGKLWLWDFSFHQFGKLLSNRVKTSEESFNWDQFWWPNEEGMSLRLTSAEEKPYGMKVMAIDFIPRKKPLPSSIVNHGYDLDAMLIKMDYEKLKAAFLGTEEEAPKTSKAKTKSEDETPTKTKPVEEEPAKKEAPACAFTKGQDVWYAGKRYDFVKVAADGVTATLLDDDGDVEKAPLAEVSDKPATKSKPKSEAPPKQLTADEAGLEKGQDVMYQGQVCSILKISPDGTSLTLLNEATDTVERAIGCADVKPADGKPTTKPKAETKPEPKSEKSEKTEAGDDDDWDKGWDDDDK